ncbi:unnamed protein product [Euphydryas editha]|uniref:RNA-directed DNA polymerase n=1 Tax=Euphydryas editha TaxID=104508 RepID=A0AAU9TNG6_EUPED|nr:unnamed protein product [Euphydryas editha]
MYLQDFDFTLEYRKGTLMAHADFLSRNPVNICAAKKPLNWAQAAQTADEETATLMERLRDGQLDSTRYVIKNDILYYKHNSDGEDTRMLCYVPKAYRLSLLRVFHDEHEHIGIEKTIDLILKHFWFPGMRHFVKKYVSHCVVCVAHKRVPRAPLQPITSWRKPSDPFKTVHADILGVLPESNGHKYVFILVDAFTKYCLLYPMRRQDSTELKRVMTNAISLFGTPQLLVCDRGRMFESSDFQNFMSDLGIDIHLITPNMHNSNGQVERYCRTVLNMIRVEVNHKSEMWSNVLWKLQLVLNVTKQKTTQCSALNLLIGSEATTPVINSLIRDIAVAGTNTNRESWRELRRQRADRLLEDNRNKQDEYVNKNRSAPRKFAVNDTVYVIKYTQSTGKLDSGMRGPYTVVKRLPNERYELRLLAGARGKTTQAAAEYMVPWRGEWTPDTCAAFFDSECN